MGIKGFWTLISPAGHRIDIATLAGKRLAVDGTLSSDCTCITM
jgi:hypothetical protein